MAKKVQTVYICSNCDAQSPKWSGQCFECGQWSTMQKAEMTSSKKAKSSTSVAASSEIVMLNESPLEATNSVSARLTTGIPECDRVLGGGLVSGSLVLLGGQPGIGKSTLVLQIAHAIENTLYISGEESAQQVGMRLERLGLNKTPISFMSTARLEAIIDHAKKEKPAVLIIDSIQTIASDDAEQAPGTVSQIRMCTAKLLELAKNNNITIIIIGHITKDGMIAGPKTLEHMVDTVLYLEGDQNNYFRILRGVKNRFGSTNEIGVFEMQSTGLAQVENPSAVFLAGVDQTIPGSMITVMNEGKRSFLVEIQSLVNKSALAIPQRKTSGYDLNRLQMLLAVLSKRIGMPFHEYDVFLNVIGGLKIKDVSIDLAICMSLISAYKDKILDKEMVAVGEVGLGGEIRPVPLLAQRINEAYRLGYKKMYIPAASKKLPKVDMQLIKVKNLQDLITKKKKMTS